MPEGVRALAELGVALDPRASFPLEGIRFLGRSACDEASFPRGRGMGIRRTVLYRALLNRAQDVGVKLLWGAQVRARPTEPVSVGGRTAHYQWLIGADGANSQVRRWAGLDYARPTSRRFGFRRHFQAAPWSNSVEVYWGGKAAKSQLFVTPVAPDELCVAMLTRHQQARVDNQLPMFPEVARRLRNAKPTSTERGSITLCQAFRSVTRGRVALVGDASGAVDAITGDGLCVAFRQAIALANAIGQNNLALYETDHRKIMHTPMRAARLLLVLDRHPELQRRALLGLGREPSLFSKLLAVHAGAAPAANFGAREALTLGWRLLTA